MSDQPPPRSADHSVAPRSRPVGRALAADAQGTARDAARPPHDHHAGADAATGLSAAQRGLPAVFLFQATPKRPTLNGGLPCTNEETARQVWRAARDRRPADPSEIDGAGEGPPRSVPIGVSESMLEKKRFENGELDLGDAARIR